MKVTFTALPKSAAMKNLLVSLVLWSLVTAPALATVAPAPATPPAASYDVGSLHVDRYGDHGRPIVLIPGLACGPWEWYGEITRLSAHNTVYALTLPGFDGRAAIAPPLFTTVTADFWKLLAQKTIVKPIVIGHSLGATTGFMLATQHPELLAGVIAVDGLPIFPGNDFSTPATIDAQSDAMAKKLATQTPAEFAASEKAVVLPFLITSPADVAAVAPLAARSDVAATAEWYREDMQLDLRPQLASATVPILLIGPYDEALDGRFFPTAAAKKAYYSKLAGGAPNLTVVIVPNSRHFIMFDQPQALDAALDAFLAAH